MTESGYISYVALLRGINVGGNNKVLMAELRACVMSAGFRNVSTYIQSGNVLFQSELSDEIKITKILETYIEKTFGVKIGVVVMSHMDLKQIIAGAPKNWGHDQACKHNLLFVKPPLTAGQVLKEMGAIREEFETVTAGKKVVYWSTSIKNFGKTASSKLISKPVYKQVTVRNYKTSVKLLDLMNDQEDV